MISMARTLVPLPVPLDAVRTRLGRSCVRRGPCPWRARCRSDLDALEWPRTSSATPQRAQSKSAQLVKRLGEQLEQVVPGTLWSKVPDTLGGAGGRA